MRIKIKDGQELRLISLDDSAGFDELRERAERLFGPMQLLFEDSEGAAVKVGSDQELAYCVESSATQGRIPKLLVTRASVPRPCVPVSDRLFSAVQKAACFLVERNSLFAVLLEPGLKLALAVLPEGFSAFQRQPLVLEDYLV